MRRFAVCTPGFESNERGLNMKTAYAVFAGTLIALVAMPSEASSRSYTYKCSDGRIFKATYRGDDDLTVVQGGKRIELHSAISGSGARYVGAGLQWWEWHGQVQLSKITLEEVAHQKIAADPGRICRPIR